MKSGTYLILRGAYIRGGLIFGEKFVLVIRGAYIRAGVCLGGLHSDFYGISILVYKVCET